MNNTKNFLEALASTPTFPEVERLPISNKIEWGFITCSADWIIRFYSIFDNSTKEITQSLLRQSDAVESELANTDNEIYKEELEALNQQLCSMVRNSNKSESLREYGIKLSNVSQLNEMLNEIVLANKRTIPGIVYLLWGPIEIKDKATGETITKQKSSSKYEWIRLFTKDKKDPVKWVVKLSDWTTVSMSQYLDNYDINPDEVRIEEGIEEIEQVSVRDYLKKKAGL